MAKDDYHVIVYQILSYLYECLKNGKDINPKLLQANSTLFKVNDKYWQYIIVNICSMNLVSGISITKAYGGDIVISNLEDAEITPIGIEYLCDNSFINKAKNFAKTALEIAPLVFG